MWRSIERRLAATVGQRRMNGISMGRLFVLWMVSLALVAAVSATVTIRMTGERPIEMASQALPWSMRLARGQQLILRCGGTDAARQDTPPEPVKECRVERWRGPGFDDADVSIAPP